MSEYDVVKCGDDRFELIGKAKAKLLEGTNIESRPEEVAVLDSVLFRCWQMGWLDKLRDDEAKAWNSHSERTCTANFIPHKLFDEPNTYKLSCGHEYETFEQHPPNYCPSCGAKVVGE